MMLTQGVPRASPRRCRRSPLLRPLTASSAAAQPPPQPPTPSAATDALRRREVLASLGCASAAVAAAASGALQPLPALARGRLKAPAEDEFQTLPARQPAARPSRPQPPR